MATEPDRPLVTREIAERDEAHRRYNEALTALDKAIQSMPGWPAPPSPYDERMLPAINEAWKIVPEGGPATVERGADQAWRVVAPFFERQMAFNAALVDHLNRNAAAHREIHDAVARALPATRDSLEALASFESLLVQFLQRITPLADARDRDTRQAIEELRNVAAVAQRAAVMAKREIERLSVGAPPTGTAAPAPSAPPAQTNAYKYLGFEDRFRGSEDEIRARLADYAPYFDGASNVLDVGSARATASWISR